MGTNARLTTLTVAVVAIMAIATAAFGAKPDKPGKPGGGDPQGLVEVSIEANLIWAHEAGDKIFYTFEVTNDSDEDVTVTDTLNTLGLPGVTVPAGIQEATFEGSYSLLPADMNTRKLANTVTARGLVSGEDTQATATVEVIEYGDCDPDGDGIFQTDASSGWSVCIWTPGPGNWTISVMPNQTRPTHVMITVRDHVPGNWCPQGVRERWRPGDDPVVTTVIIPAVPDGWAGDPVCDIGGAGGDFFNVGTPSSFYLDTTGHVTITPAPAP